VFYNRTVVIPLNFAPCGTTAIINHARGGLAESAERARVVELHGVVSGRGFGHRQGSRKNQ
jgi:hypothetical protein